MLEDSSWNFSKGQKRQINVDFEDEEEEIYEFL